MSNTQILPGLDEIKAQAKRLRSSLEAEGNFLSHSEALELVAKQYGFRNWNTMRPALPVPGRPETDLAVGGPVTGRYLGHPFRGKILGLQVYKGHRRKFVIEFDEAIDVVTSEHFSSHRRRVEGVVERNGASWEKLSNGTPVLQINA